MQICTFVILVVLANLHASWSDKPKKIDPIIYPGTRLDTDEDIPEACRNLTYCTIKPKNYPQDKFNRMFINYKGAPQPNLIISVDINNRQGDPNADDGCESDVKFEPIYKVREKREDTIWRTVVQAEEKDYVQRVRLETCKNEGGSCFNELKGKNSEYKTFCKQKYNVWEVMVTKKENERETEIIKAILPVCCVCHYKLADLP